MNKTKRTKLKLAEEKINIENEAIRKFGKCIFSFYYFVEMHLKLD